MEQKFTTMAQEAVGDAIQSASAAGNAQVETLHVMDALLRQENGVARSLIEAAGGDPQAIGAAVRNALVALPSASGSSTSQPQASRQLTAAIAQAEKEMQQMGDEYICLSASRPANRTSRPKSWRRTASPQPPCARPYPACVVARRSPARTRKARTRP